MNVTSGPDFDAAAASQPRDPLAFPAFRAMPWRRLGGATLAVAVVCAIFVSWIDRPIAIYFKSIENTAFVGVFRVLTEAGQSGIWYACVVVGFIACWRLSRSSSGANAWTWARRARAFVFMAASMLISGTAVNLLKMIFGRHRPRFLFDEGVYGFAPFSLELKACGFPSGHTQSIFAAMLALGFIWPRWRYAFWATAVLIGASRFITTVHFTADVIAGAYVAVTVALLMRAAFERNGLALAWAAAPNRLKA